MKNQGLILGIGAVALVLIAGYILMRPGVEEIENEPTSTPVSQAQDTTMQAEEPSNQESYGTIVEIASSNENFSTLVTAVTEAGLVDTLSGEGPFTVFAPTNAAFAKLPEGTIESLLQDKEALTKVLTYHVVAGEVPSTEVVKLNSAKTVQGQDVEISVQNGEVFINDSKVITADIKADNGIIHVIDAVLLPQ